MPISIHAPPRGATPRVVRRRGRRKYFNSRPSARGDADASSTAVRTFDFNSRPSARGDWKTDFWINLYCNFNSRPSARGDRTDGHCAEGKYYFNSRPSARGDDFQNIGIIRFIFQFTPLREGRPFLSVCKYCFCYFNSRPSARGDAPSSRDCVLH